LQVDHAHGSREPQPDHQATRGIISSWRTSTLDADEIAVA
jgi:hypothetical protein